MIKGNAKLVQFLKINLRISQYQQTKKVKPVSIDVEKHGQNSRSSHDLRNKSQQNGKFLPDKGHL